MGGDGTLNGVLTDDVLDTIRLFYKVDGLSTATTRVDTAFNAATFKITPTADANPLRREGLR